MRVCSGEGGHLARLSSCLRLAPFSTTAHHLRFAPSQFTWTPTHLYPPTHSLTLITGLFACASAALCGWACSTR